MELTVVARDVEATTTLKEVNAESSVDPEVVTEVVAVASEEAIAVASVAVVASEVAIEVASVAVVASEEATPLDLQTKVSLFPPKTRASSSERFKCP